MQFPSIFFVKGYYYGIKIKMKMKTVPFLNNKAAKQHEKKHDDDKYNANYSIKCWKSQALYMVTNIICCKQ